MVLPPNMLNSDDESYQDVCDPFVILIVFFAFDSFDD
jgi:hypothetical protein